MSEALSGTAETLTTSNAALQAMNLVLQQRAQQQQAVAELGLLALSNQSLPHLFAAIAERVCLVLGIEFCKILELQADGEQLLLRAGYGWAEGLVGHALVPARDGSQAAYTLLVGDPVLLDDAQQETRFTPSALLKEHNICCGMSVVIQGDQGPYGVLGVHSRTSHLFVSDDANFLQAVANLLAQAINRKAVETALQLGEERFRTALMNAPVTVSNQDLALRYTWLYNPPIASSHGQDFLGKTDYDLFPQRAEVDLLTELKQHVIKQQRAIRREVTLTVGSELRTYDFTIEPLRGADNLICGITCAATDITKAKADAAALRQSEALRQLALAGAQLGTWHYDPSTQRLSCDERCRTILGLAPDAPLTAATLLQAVHPDDRQHVYDTALVAMAPGADETKRLEARVRWPDGTVRWWVTRWGVSREEGAAAQPVVSVAGIIMDISTRKETEAQLRSLTATLERRVEERTAELARSNHDLDRFAYVASHDLSAPLRAIMQLSSWVLEDVAELLPEQSYQHLLRLQQRAERMDQLLRDLLLYSRAGRKHEHSTMVDTAELLRDIELTVSLPPGFNLVTDGPMPTFWTERAPLALVFRNLIGNAIKHHHRPEVGIVRIAAQLDAPWIVFTVSDNGPGIAAEFHQRIFEMFQTLRPRDVVEGSGMGLAIVKKTVESFNGTITVNSALGQGSTFRFTWPLQQPEV